MVRNDDRTLLEELVGDAYAFAQQAAGVLTEVEDETAYLAELVQRLGDFLLRGLLERGDVEAANV